VVDWNDILGRIADVALRDIIKRQIEIQNETISNLENLIASQKEKIVELEKRPPLGLGNDGTSLDSTLRLFESDGVLWAVTTSHGIKSFRAHCPQCHGPLTQVIDFWNCNKCGFKNFGARSKPFIIPDWAK